jgi:ParB/Sulfiredoxin domain
MAPATRPTVQYNPLACCWPMMKDEDLQQLADDILANGQRQPILLDDEDRILDGRNRHAACIIAGVEPTFEPFTGDTAAQLALVMSVNNCRRHMTAGQRATVAAKMLKVAEDLPSQLARQGEKQKKTPRIRDVSQKMDVSKKSVTRARKVIEKASPKLQKAVEDGKIAVSAAADLADKSTSTQDRAAADAYAPFGNKKRQKRRTEPATPQKATETPSDAAEELRHTVKKALFFGSIPKILRLIVNSVKPEDVATVAKHFRTAADLLQPAPKPAANGTPSAASLIMHIPGNWPADLREAAEDWIEHKQALTRKDRIQTLKAWQASCKRVAKYPTHEVVDLMQKALANNWKGWEHNDHNNGKTKSAARVRTRKSKPVKYDPIP